MRDLAAELQDIATQLAARPLAKASGDPREAHRCRSHAAFVAACDYMITRPGWSLRRLAREMGCDHTTLGDWLERGDQRSSQIPAWAFSALPAEAQPVLLRGMLGWSENDTVRRAG